MQIAMPSMPQSLTYAVVAAIGITVFAAIIRAVFGITEADRVAELKRLLPGLSAPNPLLLVAQKDLGRHSPWGRFLRRRDRVDALLYEEIRARRDAGEDERRDILTLLLAARDESGNPLTERELRDELITLLLAGHETTATSIGWAFERLLRTPRALERLTAEVKAGESGEYLDAVIKETLRVRPVVTEVFRAPTEPTDIGSYRFEPDGPTTTRVHYELAVELAVPLPGLVKRRAAGLIMGSALKELKKQVEAVA